MKLFELKEQDLALDEALPTVPSISGTAAPSQGAPVANNPIAQAAQAAGKTMGGGAQDPQAAAKMAAAQAKEMADRKKDIQEQIKQKQQEIADLQKELAGLSAPTAGV